MTIAPRRIILFGGSMDGLQMDAPIDATHVRVPAFEPRYANARAALDMQWAEYAGTLLTYQDSGRVNGAGLPIYELAA